MASRPLVAVVDDDKSIRDTTKDLLESAGFAAVTFFGASGLLKSRRLKNICCLVADMRMPGMTGLELYRRLSTSEKPIPTILITAYPDDGVRERALSAGVIGYLSKPFEDDDLAACVRSALTQGPSDGR